MNSPISNLNIKIFADGADKAQMIAMNDRDYIAGLTTNPTLMKKAGITDYKAFCTDILKIVTQKPISFEVFSDDFEEMYRQALEISTWGRNVYVKIPITNTKAEPSKELVRKLTNRGIQVNVTALMTLEQVEDIASILNKDVPSYVSVFAGRIADTGRDPVPLMKEAVSILSTNPRAELIWASPRELLNIYHADSIGCQVITVTPDILMKLSLINKSLEEYSLETVKMFYHDATSAGFKL